MTNSPNPLFQAAMANPLIDKETFIRLWDGGSKPFKFASRDLKEKAFEMLRKAAGIEK